MTSCYLQKKTARSSLPVDTKMALDPELSKFDSRPTGGSTNEKTLDDVHGRQKFNVDPKKGIESLVSSGILNDTPEDIANLLYKGEKLNKTKIGEYLGENREPNLTVLRRFVERFEFAKMDIVTALRAFLGKFRLPGEAQKIDRMMEEFAVVYCEANSTVYSKSDTCYVLAFSIIMLNTSLHNPSVKDKLTADQFVKMNNGRSCRVLPHYKISSLYLIRGWSNDRGKFHKTQVRAILAWVFLYHNMRWFQIYFSSSVRWKYPDTVIS
eukprot:sb/3468259/